MIHAVLIFNTSGKARLVKFYDYYVSWWGSNCGAFFIIIIICTVVVAPGNKPPVGANLENQDII